MKTPALKLVVPETPMTVSGTKRIMPNRRANDQLRGRFHLTEAEVSRLKATALRVNLYGFRDATMISLAFRSCLRVGELVTLTWDAVSFEEGTIHIRRLKGSDPSTHKIKAICCEPSVDSSASRSHRHRSSSLPREEPPDRCRFQEDAGSIGEGGRDRLSGELPYAQTWGAHEISWRRSRCHHVSCLCRSSSVAEPATLHPIESGEIQRFSMEGLTT
jgi:Phage integrase family